MTAENEPLTIGALLAARVKATPDAVAYHQFDDDAERWQIWRWREVNSQVAAWQDRLRAAGMQAGDHVAIMAPNCVNWALFDLAALGLGLITVPLFYRDHPDNVAFILEHSEARLLAVADDKAKRKLEAALPPALQSLPVVPLDAGTANAGSPEGGQLESGASTGQPEGGTSSASQSESGASGAVPPEGGASSAGHSQSESGAASAAPPTSGAANGEPQSAAASEDAVVPESAPAAPVAVENRARPEDLATIVYTSGTTGRPKGVMLTHANIAGNARASLQIVDIKPGMRMVSFLPLSHMFERTCGYYLPMMAGAEVAFARSFASLGDDIVHFRPHVLISVPRIYERLVNRLHTQIAQRGALAQALFKLTIALGKRRFADKRADGKPRKRSLQRAAALLLAPLRAARDRLLWPRLDRLFAAPVRERLGGRLQYAISGGAPLPPAVAEILTALELPVCQGYGLTETSPVMSVNRLHKNDPASIGHILPEVEVRIGDNNELLTRGPFVMQGYWRNPEATAQAIDAEGWFHTGDQARIGKGGRLFIIGRIKDIIVLANGEKVAPTEIEQALEADPLFSQVMAYGEGRPFLVALAAPPQEKTAPQPTAAQLRKRAAELMKGFPAWSRIRHVVLTDEPWTIENGLLTPTLKMKRHRIAEQCKEEIEKIYRGAERDVL